MNGNILETYSNVDIFYFIVLCEVLLTLIIYLSQPLILCWVLANHPYSSANVLH